MKVEFLVDKSDYKKLLGSMNFVAKNGITVNNESHKIKGKTNYIFTLSCEKNNVASAKALSELRMAVEKVFNDKDIKFKVLIDESLQYFATSLYPLACDFEIKLRSLIYMILFDIDEQANSMAVEKYKKTIVKADNNMAELPKNDFLAHLTFEEIFNFLFDNNSFIDAAKNIINQTGKVYNRRMTKVEIIKNIEALEEHTIWKVIFAPLFPKSVIPDIYDEIHEYRNRIMHIRDIDCTNYDRIKRIYKSGIRDLEQNLSKESVADDSKVNIGLLSQTLVNFYYISKSIQDIQSTILNNSHLQDALKLLNERQKEIAELVRPIRDLYVHNIMENYTIANIDSILKLLQKNSDVFDKMQALQGDIDFQPGDDQLNERRADETTDE